MANDGRFVTVTFRPNLEVRAVTGDDRTTGEVAAVARLLRAMVGDMTRQHLQEALGLKQGPLRNAYLQPALRAGLVEMTIPDKPRSQRYRLTPAGCRYLRRMEETPDGLKLRKVVSEPTLIRKKGFLVHHGTARSDIDIVEFIRAERDARSHHIAGDTTD